MAKHEKLVLDELPQSAVVNKNRGGTDNGIEDFINNAVQEHIKKIATPPKPFEIKDFDQDDEEGELPENSEEGKNDEGSIDIDNENHEQVDQQGAEHNDLQQNAVDGSVESSALDNQTADKENSSQEETNISDELSENVRSESSDSSSSHQDDHNSAFQDEARLAQQQSEAIDAQIAAKLLDALSGIVPEADFNEKVAKLSAEAISGIAKKLHLVLPVDFEEIICKGLIDKLNKFYKEGIITIKIHPEKHELCSQILQLDSIPAKFKDNFKIELDDKLTIDDCIVEWKDTALEYSKEQLSEEIDIIIQRLTNAA